MKIESHLVRNIVRSLVPVLLPLALMPLQGQDSGVVRQQRFAATTGSGRVLDLWIQSRADFNVVSAAASSVDTGRSPVFMPRRTVPDVAFLSAKAMGLLGEHDRSELRTLAEQGVPIVCECGEYALSRIAGFTPVEQEHEAAGIEFFVYGKNPDGIVRASFLSGQSDAGAGPVLTGTEDRDQIRAFLLGRALRRSLAPETTEGGGPERTAMTINEGQWTLLHNLRKEWYWTTPEVCAATVECWASQQANEFKVTANFYKVPDGIPEKDFYLVRVDSHHKANAFVPYRSASYCDDSWTGWWVTERTLRIDPSGGAKRFQWGPKGSLETETVSYSLGAGLETGAAGISAGFSVQYSNSDARIIDRTSPGDNSCDWTETFVGPRYMTGTCPACVWGFRHPSTVARTSFESPRTAIYETANTASGISLKLTPTARFQKERLDWSSCILADVFRVIGHPYTTGANRPEKNPDIARPIAIRWNFAPNRPDKPRLTGGSSGFWVNTPITVEVPAGTDRDGDPLTYSVNFGDGTTGSFGPRTQTHQWTRPDTVHVTARVRDIHGAVSESWSEDATYPIKGLDRIEIEAPGELPELSAAQFQCRATMTDATTRSVASDYPSGWEGGAIRWSVSSPFATVSNTGLVGVLGAQGADRVVTVEAVYTLKGIAKRATHTLVVRNSGLGPVISSVVNGASFQPRIAGSAWTTIYGVNLAGAARSWRGDEIVGGRLPMTLDGVSVTMNDRPAAICYVSPTQLNVQAPSGLPPGEVTVRVRRGEATATATVQMSDFAPGLFTIAGRYAAALHADYSYVGRPGLLAGVTTSQARPGETIVVYGAGFGPTVPDLQSGAQITTPAPLAHPVTVWIGNRAADVRWNGMSAAGLWQLNVVIPSDVPDGDAEVVAEAGGARTQAGVFVTVQR